MRSGSSRSANRSRCSSVARWRPSARRSTAMSRPSSPTRSDNSSQCRITGVQPFGFFATVEDLGGDGLVLAQGPGPGIFPLRRGGRALVGDESGETYRVGQRLTLRLAEANPVSGSLRFELPEGSYGGRSAPVRRDRVRTTGRAWPARQHPPPGSRPSLILAMPPDRNGGFEHGETVALGSLRAGLRLRTDPDRGRGRLADLVAQAHLEGRGAA